MHGTDVVQDVPGRGKCFKINEETNEWELVGIGYVRLILHVPAASHESGGEDALASGVEVQHEPMIAKIRLMKELNGVEDSMQEYLLPQNTDIVPEKNSLVWFHKDENKNSSEEYALSFEGAGHCQRIWESLSSYCGNFDQEDANIDENISSTSTASISGVEMKDALPECTYGNLKSISLELDNTLPHRRQAAIEQLRDGKFIQNLMEVHEICSDMEDTENLVLIFEIVKKLFHLNDMQILDILLSDEIFLSVAGILESNPKLSGDIDFQSFLEREMKFKELIPIEDESIVRRIHMNYRIEAIKDNMLVREFNDMTFNKLCSLVQENNYEILMFLTDRPEYVKGIEKAISCVEERKSGLKLLQELFRLAKRFQEYRFGPPRPDQPIQNFIFTDFYHKIALSIPILSAIQDIFESKQCDTELHSLVIELLTTLIDVDGATIRKYIASQKHPSLPSSVDQLLAVEKGGSMATALLYSLQHHDSNRPAVLALIQNLLSMDLNSHDSHNVRFLGLFYDHYIVWVLHILAQSLSLDQMHGQQHVMYNLTSSVCTILQFCLKSHGYRMRYVIHRHPVFQNIMKLVDSESKFYVLWGIKFIRECVGLKEGFYSRYLVNNRVLVPVFRHLDKYGRMDNTISSAIYELIHYISENNLVILVEYIYKTYYEKFHQVVQVPGIFAVLRKRYEDNVKIADEEEAMSVHQKSNSNQSTLSTPQQRIRNRADDDESYFDTEEDDEKTPPRSLRYDENGQKTADSVDTEEVFVGPLQLVESAKEENEPNLPPLVPQTKDTVVFNCDKHFNRKKSGKFMISLGSQRKQTDSQATTDKSPASQKRKRSADSCNDLMEVLGSPKKLKVGSNVNDDFFKEPIHSEQDSLLSSSDELLDKVDQLKCSSNPGLDVDVDVDDDDGVKKRQE